MRYSPPDSPPCSPHLCARMPGAAHSSPPGAAQHGQRMTCPRTFHAAGAGSQPLEAVGREGGNNQVRGGAGCREGGGAGCREGGGGRGGKEAGISLGISLESNACMQHTHTALLLACCQLPAAMLLPSSYSCVPIKTTIIMMLWVSVNH